MADKDTREADGPAGEAMPFPEAPRSEGGPATREPEPTDGRAASRPEPTPPAAEIEPADPGTVDAGGADMPSTSTPDQGIFEAPPAAIPTAAETPDLTAEPFREPEPTVSRETENEPDTDVTTPFTEPEPSIAHEVMSEPDGIPDTAEQFTEPEPYVAHVVATEPDRTLDVTEPFAEPEPGAAHEIATEPDSAPDLAEPVTEPEPYIAHVVATEPDGTADVAETEAWRSAIAEALVEAPTPPPASVAREAWVPAPLEPDPEPAPVAPETPHGGDAATPSAPDSFTAAAADLFHPPEAKEEPHLITLGRRLDPALRIPRPELPDIAPRPEPDAAKPAPWWKTTPWTAYLRKAARYGAYAVAGYLALVLVLIVLFRFVNPPGSMLMLTQFLTGTAIDRTWVPLSAISPHLVRAVIVSEDGRFCEHSGVDTAAIKEAIERAARGTPRGASTISMQLTKNLFLWNAKSYVRKVIEIPLTLIMELVWPKRRVLEVYLNIAEWAPGVFGAEAAARRHFQKSAARLSERESALLAAVLPNPVVRDAGSPGPQTSAKARVVQARVKAYGTVASCVVSAAAPAPAVATPSVVKPRPARKPAAQRPAPARKKQPQQKVDDWAPILNFGPR